MILNSRSIGFQRLLNPVDNILKLNREIVTVGVANSGGICYNLRITPTSSIGETMSELKNLFIAVDDTLAEYFGEDGVISEHDAYDEFVAELKSGKIKLLDTMAVHRAFQEFVDTSRMFIV